MNAFNLLQYPALASQRRRFHSRWTSLSGLLVGSLVALWLGALVQEKRQQRVQETAYLTSRLKQMENRLVADKARLAEQNTWLDQAKHVQALSAQQRSLEALHQALLQEAGPESVQLLRLQLDAQRLELHGQAKDAQRMAQARARLSLPLAAPSENGTWALVSWVHAPGTQGAASPAPLEFVWQTPWPQVGSGPAAATPIPNPQLAESGKERP